MSILLTDSYTHCPICGSTDFRRPAPGQRQCAACGHRDFNNPITAVAAFLLDPGDHVLLIRRAKPPGEGRLAPPGGFVDAGETLEEAVRREVEEEIGLRIADLSYVSSHPNSYVYAGKARPVCDAFFSARVDSFDNLRASGEVSGWVVRRLAEVDPSELAFESMQRAFVVFRERQLGPRT